MLFATVIVCYVAGTESQVAGIVKTGRDVKPFLLAARNIFLKSGYTLLSVVGVVLIVHVAGLMIFHYFRTRHVFPVRCTYVAPSTKPSPSTSTPVCNTTAAPSISTPLNQNDTEEDDDVIEVSDVNVYDEDESELKTYITASAVESACSTPLSKTNSIAGSFKYSETKV